MRVAALYRYPVKSLAGEALEEVAVDARGPRRDRHWMVVDADGRFVTQRAFPRMCLVSAALAEDDALTLSAPGMAPLQVAAPGEDVEAARADVVVWDDQVSASPTDPLADAWLTEFLGTQCRLVHLRPDSRRQVDPAFADPGDQVGFADGYSFLLISQASLDDLSERVGKPVEMRRFRPNIEIAGCGPFAEDGWQRIRIGTMEFRVVKPCTRCTVPAVDPRTGERDGSVTRTLASYRRRDRAIVFGQNLIHEGEGRLAVGMDVEVLA